MSPAPRPAKTSDVDASGAKRRKIRKGTHSCWACKRRKEKCFYDPDLPTNASAVCIGCHRRGTRCISQEFPEDVSGPPADVRQIGDRMVRIEALVEHLIKRLPGSDGTMGPDPGAGENSNAGIPASASNALLPLPKRSHSTLSPDRPHHPICQNHSTVESSTGIDVLRPFTAHAPSDKYGELSRTLYESLPSPQDIKIIYRASSHHVNVFNAAVNMPYTTLGYSRAKSPDCLLVAPEPNTHPVLIAKYLLELALLLQHFPPNVQEEIRSLSESLQAMIERLADAAIRLVTTQDRLVASVEGLECVMLEGLYHANCGSLRLSWLAIRRAMLLAQAMGFHQSKSRLLPQVLNSPTTADTKCMWFRIVLCDRYLSLMLGLPQGSTDRSIASEAILAYETPVDRLERLQCIFAAQILERNESDFASHDLSMIQSLDRELQRAARSLPSRWWLTSNLGDAAEDEQDLFSDMRRVPLQMHHYNLLNQLHLPYMLLPSTEHKYEYSKIACVNASREILSRSVVLRSFNQIACSCRIADFQALMAAMTLVLAHLDSHRRPSQADSLLAHLYLSDRAMMEQAQENMEEVSRLNADTLSAQSARLLRRLLAIEAQAASGHMTRAASVSVQTPGTTNVSLNEVEDSRNAARVHIPYFGVIKVACNSKEISNSSQLSAEERDLQMQHPAAAGEANPTKLNATHPKDPARSISLPGRGALPDVRAPSYYGFEGQQTVPCPATAAQTEPRPNIPALSSTSDAENNKAFPPNLPQFQGGLFDPLLPGLTDNANDWPFQDINMAFFDNLMRGADDDGEFGPGSWSMEN